MTRKTGRAPWGRDSAGMHVSARADYGVRALLELTVEYRQNPERLVTTEVIAERQSIPAKFLESILRQLRTAGIVDSRRGAEGGYRLARSPETITMAEALRALDGPLAAVKGVAPENIDYPPPATHLREVWVALRMSLRQVLEGLTLSDVARGDWPSGISELIADPDAWTRRSSDASHNPPEPTR